MTIQPYLFKLATSPQEIAAYFHLRYSIFVEEQGLFQSSDVDELDTIAYPIIAIEGVKSNEFLIQNSKFSLEKFGENQGNSDSKTTPTFRKTQNSLKVLGVVRIYEPEPGLWYGGRLGVYRDDRRAGKIGKGLIYKAVTTANTWGCQRFLATVQLQNVRFFQRLHWNSLEEVMIFGLPHYLMEADLNYYPPGTEVRPVLPISMCEAS